MSRQENLYQSEDPSSNRWARSIGVFLGHETNIEILSKEAERPEGNHPLCIQAKSIMQSFRSIETANAMTLLLSGIGEFKNGKKIKAAQFLFSSLDFSKIDHDFLRDTFTSAVTNETPTDNIHAVIKTGEKIAPNLLSNEAKFAVLRGLHNIQIKLPEDSITEDIKAHIEQVKKGIPVQEPEIIFDVSRLAELTESDMRIIVAHHQGVPHKKIAENEGVIPHTVSTRLGRLRGKGVPVERRRDRSKTLIP
jgi:hypothetical protein